VRERVIKTREIQLQRNTALNSQLTHDRILELARTIADMEASETSLPCICRKPLITDAWTGGFNIPWITKGPGK
jgi:predicted ATPase with chaperone activity